MSKKTLIIALILYLVSALGSFGLLRAIGGTSTGQVAVSENEGETDTESNELALLNIDPKEPKDQPCPLNGKMFTKTERDAWEKRRPLMVMIENTPDARPQSGLSDADVVFEAVAEYGITRFMAGFYCQVQAADTTLAPIRSARIYFVHWASGFNFPLYVHVGGANVPGKTDALGAIGDYGWNQQNDLNQFSIGFPTFKKNGNRIGRPVATEHTMETSTEKLWAVAEKRGWTNMSPGATVRGKKVVGTDWKAGYKGWTFQDGQAGKGTTTQISYDFWSGFADYSVAWQYDQASNTYKRSVGGASHVDLNNDKQIAASNVIVLFTKEEGPLNNEKHMYYTTEGTGDILLFQNGEVIKGTWSKKTRESELQFFDTKGNPVQLVRGMTWISTLAKNAPVKY